MVKKLLGLYKGLPPEMKMMLAMMGLGTPIGIIYFLQRVGPLKGVAAWKIMLGVAVVIGVIAAIGFLISWLAGSRSRRRREAMGEDIGERSTGATASIDERAKAKANNTKFFNAVRSMRRDVGVNVYDLPWYIVIGDSGCGKTKLVNEGGLVFGQGRPEGYQLGTLDYNWWFTEDAIFLDMAGRLCNPQESVDHREWLAFLETIKKGRPGFPINGAIVCVSADHLLEESSEKHERDANTLLERLRELQRTLGVTFATYFVITKCDKIVGFMQFFDRVGYDITTRKQIFGWAKPGEYGELYNPDQFDNDFGKVYGRLNELRLNRLFDDDDEIDRGLAHAFPEEFRALKSPLETYMRILFPMVKNPKAIKNLLFRGVFFTSATQTGELILGRLAERLGEDARQQFAPLDDLYPDPSPHFVRDFLVEKVFPEQGLVFRNEAQVQRNRKLAKMLKIGAPIMFVLIMVLLVWSASKFGRLITDPKLKAERVALAYGIAEPEVEGPDGSEDREHTQGRDSATGGDRRRTSHATAGMLPSQALELSAFFQESVENLRKNRMAAAFLSLGIGSNAPIRDLTTIRVRVFEDGVLLHTLRQVDAALRRSKPLHPPQSEEDIAAAESYLAALQAYVKWYGCSEAREVPASLTFRDFEAMCSIIEDPKSPAVENWPLLRDQADNYFKTISSVRGTGQWRNPARLLGYMQSQDQPYFDPPATIASAVRTVHAYLEHYATLDAEHPDPVIAEWLRIQASCAAIESSYQALLDASKDIEAITTEQQLEDFRTAFIEQVAAMEAAIQGCTWQRVSTSGEPLRIPPLAQSILEQRQRWTGYAESLKAGYESCGSYPSGEVLASFDGLVTGQPGALRGLDHVLIRSLQEAQLISSERGYFEEFFEEAAFAQLVAEVYERYDYMITLKKAPENSYEHDRLVRTQDVADVEQILTKVAQRLKESGTAVAGDLAEQAPHQWLTRFREFLMQMARRESTADAVIEVKHLSRAWAPEVLLTLWQKHETLIARGEGTILMRTLAERLHTAGGEDWGIGVCYPEWRTMVDSAYQMREPQPAAGPTAPPSDTPDLPEPPKPGEGSREIFIPGQTPREIRRPEEATARADVRRAGVFRKGRIPRCAKTAFLNQTAQDAVYLMIYLDQTQPTDYLAGEGQFRDLPQLCRRRIREAVTRYFDQYITNWAEAYGQLNLEKFEQLRTAATSWEELRKSLGPNRASMVPSFREIAQELETSLQEILRALPWATYDADGYAWTELAADARLRPWAEVNDWFDTLLSSPEKWPSAELGAFVTQARAPYGRPAVGEKPWNKLARDMAARWEDVVVAIEAVFHNKPVPDRYTNTTPAITKPIPWAELDRLRKEARIEDERITGQFADFLVRARDLLSAELSQTLGDIQQHYFRGTLDNVYDGLPYLNQAGSGLTATQTVPYREFRDFLFEIGNAQRVLAKIEEDFPTDDEARQKRMELYRSCEQWRTFMDFNTSRDPQRLVVEEIVALDPLAKGWKAARIQDTAQNYYRSIRLSLGLDVVGVNEAAPDQAEPLEIGTRQNDRFPQKAYWRWIDRKQPLKMEFIQPREHPLINEHYPEIVGNHALVLGDSSPLAFCAYLHRYDIGGRNDDGGEGRNRREWVTEHGINLSNTFKKLGKEHLAPEEKRSIMGTRLRFRLQRSMPDPIIPLSSR